MNGDVDGDESGPEHGRAVGVGGAVARVAGDRGEDPDNDRDDSPHEAVHAGTTATVRRRRRLNRSPRTNVAIPIPAATPTGHSGRPSLAVVMRGACATVTPA